jgi:hypothetical protein
MKIKRFNESTEVNIDFDLLDRKIYDIRECLLEFEDEERVKYLMNRVYFTNLFTSGILGNKRGQKIGNYLNPQLNNYDTWINCIHRNLNQSGKDGFIKQNLEDKPTLLLQAFINMRGYEDQFPTAIDMDDLDLVVNSIEKLKLKFDDVSLFFNKEDGKYGVPKQIAVIGVYFNLKS